MPIGIIRGGSLNPGSAPLSVAEGYGYGTNTRIVNLLDLVVPVPSYFSNYGVSSSSTTGEGHWIDIYRNGQYQVAGVDFFESPVRGTGATYVTFSEVLPAPTPEEIIVVIVYKL